ncbi:hypothetical protein HZU77_007645 [Neisseriaceae bacterium TC5R-5]|nr:hypothetical protein [Neisseriaceae bacterium TC5R-5]
MTQLETRPSRTGGPKTQCHGLPGMARNGKMDKRLPYPQQTKPPSQNAVGMTTRRLAYEFAGWVSSGRDSSTSQAGKHVDLARFCGLVGRT